MTLPLLGPSPVDEELADALTRVEAGESPRSLERRQVDFKEEAGRRDRRTGGILPATSDSEVAAKQLAEEAACMANTPGGGALVVGLADDGAPIGTELATEWLRHRIFELTERQVTADIREGRLKGVRVVVLKMVEALSPVKYRGVLRWRVDTNCVEVDSSSWFAGRLHRLGHDWSAETSNYDLSAVKPAALQRAREYLRASGESGALELAEAPDADLLRRINVTTNEGNLTNAGALLFVGRGDPAVDYIRRERAGSDSTVRLRDAGRSLLEELRDVEQAVSASNPAVHVESGLAVGQIRQLPPLAVREAVVNGVVHRDWQAPAPTTVEHVGASLIVTSPGGFVGTVRPENIITHPSAPRYKALAEAMASLRVAEREGVGVDRMVREMIRVGYRPFVIEETAGPHVRAALVGGRVDAEWLRFLSLLEPIELAADLDVLLLLRRLVEHAWVDVAQAQPILQRNALEAEDAVARLSEATIAGTPVIRKILGVPAGHAPAWRFSNPVRRRLASRLVSVTGPAGRANLATEWATARGRVSTTELGDISGVAVNAAGSVLRALEDDGVLGPSRGNRTGAGFHYIPRDA